MNKIELRATLLSWYDEHKREMPWRECNNPYLVWVSEIMLQQTRVDQVEPYFNRFVERFPTIFDLAGATQQEVLKIWEGLGYYSRARNLHQAAKTIVTDFNGIIPHTWDDIIQLKGIGPYTAAAVLSIAYSKPYAAVDGNVIRVLSRFYGIEDDVSRNATKKVIQNYADELVDENRPGEFNQAVMELGAGICSPKAPNCPQCPLQVDCMASKMLRTDAIPYKAPKKKVPHHHIGVGIIMNKKGEVLIAHRPEDGMLGGLWEFPGGKQELGESMEQTTVRESKEELGVEVCVVEPFMQLNHAYSHFKITLHSYICELVEGTPKANTSQQIKWVQIKELGDYPFPKANRRLTEKLQERFN